MPATSTGEETKKAIHEAAVRVIAKHGFQAASLREIAKEVGIAAPSLYNHIKSKEKLLFELLKVPLQDMIAEYRARTQEVADPVARLEIFTQVHLNFHLNSRLEVFIGNMELRSLTPAHYRTILGLREEYAQLLQSIIEDGTKEGVFTAPEPRVITLVMLGMLSGVCNWYRPDGPMSAKRMIQLHLDLVFRALGASPPSDTLASRRRARAASLAAAT
jgi:AcrR family transcriptional regulator